MLSPGNVVLIVRDQRAPSSMLSGYVRELSPLRLEGALAGGGHDLAEGERVALLHVSADEMSQAWGVVVHSHGVGDRWTAEFRTEEYVGLERRKTTRYSVNLVAEAMLVLESTKTIELHTAELAIEQISETGCFATAELPLSRGDLISISIIEPTTGERHRVLGIVARAVEPNGFGIEFFDHAGDARGWLDSFIANLRDIGERGAA